MRVRLTTDVFSTSGARLAEQLDEYQDDMEFHCACPDGLQCTVVVQESGDQAYDVIVIRPGYAPPPGDSWTVIRKNRECRYIASFRNPTALQLATAALELIAIPLIELL